MPKLPILLVLLAGTASAFQAPCPALRVARAAASRLSDARMQAPRGGEHEKLSHELQADRRNFLKSSILAPVAASSAFAVLGRVESAGALAPAPQGTKVVVFGGNGFVGSRVSEQLVAAGAKVVSISRSGAPPVWAKGQEWMSKVSWIKGDPIKEDWSDSLAGSAAVVSCIGVIGGSDESMVLGNGAVNVAVAQQTASAGVDKMVYISVSDAVGGAVGGFALKGYFKGKKEAEAAITKSFGKTAVILAPTFIYGGDEFSATPPRVAEGYGSFVEGALSSGPIRALAGVMPGIVALALLPPVSVNSLATAAAGAALGTVKAGRVDGTDAINAAAAAAAAVASP